MHLTEFTHWKSCLNEKQQKKLLFELSEIINNSPFFKPEMPGTGKPFSVMMTNCGELGWVSDKERGYRYQADHPETGKSWMPIPGSLLDLWNEVTHYPKQPEACLINGYASKAKMGLHQDRDEEDLDAPVLSISLGAPATFRIGGNRRNDPTRSLRLSSGDVIALAGRDRLAFHGVDRILKNDTDILREYFPYLARINLTLRRVTK